MSASAPDREAAAKAVDAALADWRQGDLALDEQWFVHVGEPSNPLTGHATEERRGRPSCAAPHHPLGRSPTSTDELLGSHCGLTTRADHGWSATSRRGSTRPRRTVALCTLERYRRSASGRPTPRPRMSQLARLGVVEVRALGEPRELEHLALIPGRYHHAERAGVSRWPEHRHLALGDRQPAELPRDHLTEPTE